MKTEIERNLMRDKIQELSHMQARIMLFALVQGKTWEEAIEAALTY